MSSLETGHPKDSFGYGMQVITIAGNDGTPLGTVRSDLRNMDDPKFARVLEIERAFSFSLQPNEATMPREYRAMLREYEELLGQRHTIGERVRDTLQSWKSAFATSIKKVFGASSAPQKAAALYLFPFLLRPHNHPQYSEARTAKTGHAPSDKTRDALPKNP